MRLTVLNQFYAPDISPTAQLAASLSEHRAELGDDVTVITGRAGYLEGLSGTSGRAGAARVRVRRVWTPDLGKSSELRRVVGYLAYFVGAALRILRLPRQDVIVAMTTPPFAMVVALLHKALHRHTRVVLWSMDCYPDAAERFGELTPGGVASRVLRWINRAAFRRLDHVIVLDGAMGALLASQYAAGPDAPPVTVVPNWERADQFPAGAPVERWSGWDEIDTAGRIVVLYLGNTGVGHQFGTAVDAAAALADEAVFVFVGGGAKRADLAQAVAERALTNVVLRDYVPKEATGGVMAGADAALITLDERSLAVMSPSKLHANLAAGLPILYVGPPGSNVDEAIARFDCGASLREGDGPGLVEAVRALAGDTTGARRRARAAFDAAYCDTATLPQLDAILDAGPRG